MSDLNIHAGELNVRLDAGGGVGRVLLNGRSLPLCGPGGFGIEEVLPPRGQVRDVGRVAGRAASEAGGVRFEGELPDAGIELAAVLRGGACIDVAGEVRDRTGRDRALRVTFTLPLDLAGWTWQSTATCVERIAAGVRCPSRPADLHYLGKKGEHFADEDPAVYPIPISKLPFAVVHAAGAGLAMAYPLHEPRVFLIAAGERGLSITFRLGLAPDVERLPGRAGFRFVLYPIDAAWGIRSAAERYYDLFGELSATAAARHGNYGTFIKPSREPWPPRPEDFFLTFLENDFQWSDGELRPEEADIASRLNSIAFHWREPFSWFHQAGPELTAEQELDLLRAQADGRAEGGHGTGQYCGAPQEESVRSALASYTEDDAGRLQRNKHTYGCWSLPMNLDPNLPAPNRAALATNWQFRYIDRWSDPDFRGPRNFAWDSLDDWSGFRKLNFRREHFACSDIPLTFDPASGRLCQVVGFHDWSFTRHHSKIIREAGGLVMANVNLEHAMMYCGAHVDVFVRERAVKDYDEQRLSVMRMLARGKPITFLGSWQPREPDALEAVLRKLLLFGMAPGSAMADHERALYAKYMPVLIAVAEAGWRPIPHARGEGLWVERFGDRPGGLYFTAANRGDAAGRFHLAIDAAALGFADRLADVRIAERLEGRPLEVNTDGGRLDVAADFRAGETLVLQL